MRKYYNLTFLVPLLVLFLFQLLLRWNSFTTPFERDEGEYAYSAWLLRSGGMPYRDSFLQKPPLIIYTYLLGQLVSPQALWPPRLAAFIFSLITAFLIYKIANYKASLIFLAIAASPINSSLAANTEIFMLLPLVFFWYLLQKKKSWFLAGVAASLAILYKPICFYVTGFIGVYFLLKTKRPIVGFLNFCLGGLVTVFIVLLPFLLGGAIRYFWDEVIVFNGYYAKHWGISLLPLLSNLKAMFPSFWLIYGLLAIYYLVRPERWKFYSICLCLSLLAVFQTNIRHYFLLLTPFMAIMVSQVVDKWPKKIGLLGMIVLLSAIFWPVREQFSKTPQDLSLWIYGRENPFYEAPLVAEKLAAITKPDDRVFIAGSEPEILYYAGRKSVTRFVITYPLTIETPMKKDYRNELAKDLIDEEPQAIVVSTRVHSGLWGWKVPNNYSLEGAFVWDLRGGYWLDNPDENDLSLASLLLYRKL